DLADKLGYGQVVTQHYLVTINDGQGGTATQDIAITIIGVDDNFTITVDDATGVEGSKIPLHVTLSVPQSHLTSLVVSSIPVGAILSDGQHTFTATSSVTSTDIV